MGFMAYSVGKIGLGGRIVTIYISLLRGINVGGQKSIKMAELKSLYEALDYQNVHTYVQSGNVVFESNANSSELKRQIRDGIVQKFGFPVDILVRTLDDWRKLITANPYARDATKDIKFLHITLLTVIPDADLVNRLAAPQAEGEAYAIHGDVVYLYCPNGYGRTKLTNNYWEKALKVSATTRNWNTVNHLLELAESIQTT